MAMADARVQPAGAAKLELAAGGRGSSQAGGAGKAFKVDPLDEGNLPVPLIDFSRALARLLRYGGQGLKLDAEGWCPIREVLQVADFAQWQEKDLDTVVRESFSKNQRRFEVEQRGNERWIRASHKRNPKGGSSGDAALDAGGAPPAAAEQKPLVPLPPVPGTSAPVAAPVRAGGRAPAQQQQPYVRHLGPPASSGGSRAAPARPFQGPDAVDPWANGSDPWSGFRKTSAPQSAAAKAAAPTPKPAAPVFQAPPVQAAPAQQTAGRPDTPQAPPVQAAAAQQTAGPPGAVQSRATLQPPPVQAPAPQQAAGRPDAVQAPQPAPPMGAQTFFIGDDDEQRPPERLSAGAGVEAAAPEPDAQALQGADVGAGRHVVISSTGATWEQFALPEEDGGGAWWSCTRPGGEEDCFTEANPGSWSQFEDPDTGKPYWWNQVTEEFFFP